MKMYDLTANENKLVSAIINDITKPYKAHICTDQYGKWVNEGILKVRQRAISRGLLLDEADWVIPTKDLKAIIRSDDGQAS